MLTAFRNIRFKVSFFVVYLLIIMTFVFYFVTVQIMNRHILDEVVKRAEGLSRSIAASAGYSFLSKDLLGLDNIVFNIKGTNQDVEYIAIVDTDYKTIVHSTIDKNEGILKPSDGQLFRRTEDGIIIKEVHSPVGPIFEVVSPIVFMNKQLGSVILGINKSVMLNAQHAARIRIAWVLVITILLGFVGSIILSTFLTRPIKELSSGVAELKEGKRSRPLKIYSKDELGKLTQSFNEMADLITEQRDRLGKAAHDLEESYVSTVKVLAAAIDAKDPYTHGHSARVSQLSLQLGRRIGLSSEELENLEIACLFHDVGKIKTPDAILRKKGRLSPHEYTEMMRHTEYGADILSKAPSLNKYIPTIRHHHESYDGTGYPDGLKGEDIPIFAAIISIADAYDAMTSNRPYRNALSEKEALIELVNSSGTQFNPDLIKHFVEIIVENNITVPENAKQNVL